MRVPPRVVCGAALLGALALASPANAAQWTVHRGQSIQRAIDQAQPGDTITVDAGVYRESLFIQKDDLTIRGAGAGWDGTVLRQPATPPPGNLCDTGGSMVGFCVLGLVDASFNVLDQTHGTHISGFVVAGFPSEGVFEYGADASVYRNNRFQHNGGYGLFSLTSTGVTIANNYASGSGEAGIYVGDSPSSGARVFSNEVVNNAQGFLFRDSANGAAWDNDVHGNCAGALVLDTAAPTQASGWVLRDNRVWQNNKACPGNDEAPPLSGIGIAIVGAQSTTVKGNTIFGHHPTGPTVASAGIGVLSGALAGGSNPDGASIVDNVLRSNKPQALLWDGSGAGVTFSGNVCRTSTPAGLCAPR